MIRTIRIAASSLWPWIYASIFWFLVSLTQAQNDKGNFADLRTYFVSLDQEGLLSKGDSEYIKWASAQMINKLGYDEGELSTKYNIGPHAKWVLNLKWSKA